MPAPANSINPGGESALKPTSGQSPWFRFGLRIKVEFTAGPDGRRYATEGEVQIDTSEASGDPEATITKMRQIRSAALAPAEPSSKDRQVAVEAVAEARARTELIRQRREEEAGDDSDGSPFAAGDLSAYEAGSRSMSSSIAGAFIDVIV